MNEYDGALSLLWGSQHPEVWVPWKVLRTWLWKVPRLSKKKKMIPFHLFDLKRFLTSSYIMILYFISKSSLKSMYTHQKKKKFQNCWYISGCPNITHEKKYVQLTCKRFTSLFHDQLNATSFHIPIFPLASREKTKRKDTMSYCICLNCKIFNKYNENEFIENVLSCFFELKSIWVCLKF